MTENDPIISIFVAVAKNGVIGAKGDMPWKLSSDLKRFKAGTMGKPLVMGRKTFESIGRPLPGRPNIVVTRNTDYSAEGVIVVTSLSSAIEAANEQCEKLNVNEICLIGGGQLYKEAFELADRLYVTHVMSDPEGDTWFPAIDLEKWRIVTSEDIPAGEKDSAATKYAIYERL